MNWPGEDLYLHVEAFLEPDHQVDWMGDGVLCQLVTLLMTSDEPELFEPAVCKLTAAAARDLAFRLLCVAEHADRLTRHRPQP